VKVMEFTSFVSGVLSAALAYAVFTSKKDPELAEGLDDDLDHDHEDTIGRSVIMMCTTCRKQKRHREIERDFYECTRCKRQIDLRR